MDTRYRKLDPLEAGFELLNTHFAGTANLVATVELTVVLAGEKLEAAAAQLQTECAWLRVRIERDGDALWFAPDASPLAIRVTDESREATVRQELATPFPGGTGPLCRLVIVKTADAADTVVVAVHHSICDANSVQDLVYRFVHLCTEDAPANAAIPEFPREPYAILSRPSWPIRKRTYAWYRLFRYALFVRKGGLLRFESAEPDPSKRSTTLADWSLDEADTRALVQAARDNDASVSGALCAAALWVAREYERGGDEPTSLRLRVNCNVGLWPLLRAERLLTDGTPSTIGSGESSALRWPTLGSFVTMIQLGARLERDSKFWQVARTCTQAARRPRETVRDVSMLVGDIMRGRASKALPKMTRDPRTCGRVAAVHVSNVGVIDGGHRPNHVRAFRFAVPQQAMGAMVWVSAATVNGCLHGSLLTTAPLISADTSRHMSLALGDVLRAMCATP